MALAERGTGCVRAALAAAVLDCDEEALMGAVRAHGGAALWHLRGHLASDPWWTDPRRSLVRLWAGAPRVPAERACGLLAWLAEHAFWARSPDRLRLEVLEAARADYLGALVCRCREGDAVWGALRDMGPDAPLDAAARAGSARSLRALRAFHGLREPAGEGTAGGPARAPPPSPGGREPSPGPRGPPSSLLGLCVQALGRRLPHRARRAACPGVPLHVAALEAAAGLAGVLDSRAVPSLVGRNACAACHAAIHAALEIDRDAAVDGDPRVFEEVAALPRLLARSLARLDAAPDPRVAAWEDERFGEFPDRLWEAHSVEDPVTGAAVPAGRTARAPAVFSYMVRRLGGRLRSLADDAGLADAWDALVGLESLASGGAPPEVAAAIPRCADEWAFRKGSLRGALEGALRAPPGLVVRGRLPGRAERATRGAGGLRATVSGGTVRVASYDAPEFWMEIDLAGLLRRVPAGELTGILATLEGGGGDARGDRGGDARGDRERRVKRRCIESN